MPITVSAPGKLMLLGEHAVVYGHPCLVTTVNQRMRVAVEKLSPSILTLEAEDVELIGYKKPIRKLGKGKIPKRAMFIEIAMRNFFYKYSIQSGLNVITKSEFSPQFGFGSSSAVTVCLIKALSELFKINLTLQEIFDLSYKTISDIQKEGSGFDAAAAIYGGTLYFTAGGKIIEPLPIDELNLVVGYSGVKADTVSMINLLKEKIYTYKSGVEKIFDKIADLVKEAKKSLLSKDWIRFGTLMNFNQDYLEDLGLSTEKLGSMILAARKAGVYGAKLSGAGGGDCMIALVTPENKKQVATAIERVGGEIVEVTTNVEGVKSEK